MSSPHENRWPSDGHDHQYIERKNIYENAKIRSFLDGTHITLLIASKGMGKTLLMRVKKKLLKDARTGVTLIPASDAEFDEPKLHGSFPATGYSDVLLWKDLWTFAIVMSALMHLELPDKTKACIRKHLEKFPIDDRIRDEITDAEVSIAQNVPSHYLAYLIENFTEVELHKLRKAMHTIDDLSSKYITSAVDFFVDAFDQTLQETFPGNLDAWKAGQLGLVKAAHTLFTTNHHIKVYATIRQEAWAGFVDADKQVIRGKSLILEPTEADLKQLFSDAILRYTGKKSIEAFLGVDRIFNVYCDEYEDCFRYILRHSSSSPRSLMHFGKALDETDLDAYTADERMKRIREVVDDTSAENIFADYLESQKQMFMTTLNTEPRLRTLLRLIPANTLTGSSLWSINKKFCALVGLDHSESHPFCELFNSGLIGQVRSEAASGGYFQYFRKPHEFDWNQQGILEADALYVLHPGLVSHLAKSNRLRLNKFIVIEPDHPWQARRGHTGIPTIFISHASVDKPVLEPFLVALEDELNLLFPGELWIDKERIVPGDNIHAAVQRGIASSDIVVLFASKASLASGWVEEEWRTKHQKEVKEKRTRVIVAIIDDTRPSDLPPFLSGKLASICCFHSSPDKNAGTLARAIATQSTKLLDSIFADSLTRL
jgi:hypothetical protein